MLRTNVMALLGRSVVVMVFVVLAAGDTAAWGGDRSEMGREFERLGIGWTAADMKREMGPPSKTLEGRESESWTRAYVWEYRKYLISKETAVAVFDGDRVVMLVHSSGRLDNIRERINEGRRRSIGNLENIEVAGTSEQDSWAEVPYMLSRLEDESDGKLPLLDARTGAAFDQITPDATEDDIVKLLGEPTDHKTKPAESIYTWLHNGETLVVIFANSALVEKSLTTPEMDFTVKEGYWNARSRNDGVRIIVRR